MNRRAVVSVITFTSFVLVTLTVIVLANGYRFNSNTKQLQGTGILTVKSDPTGATILINGADRGNTNDSFSNLIPGTYQVTVKQDGYSPWQQTAHIEAGKVVNLLALLIPINPSLAPITSTPTANPVLSPDGQKLAYAVPTGSSAGIWLLDLSSQPFGLTRKPSQMVADSAIVHFSSGQLRWAPNNRELLVTLDNGLSANIYLLAVDNSHAPENVSSSVATLLQRWDDEKKQAQQEFSADLPDQAQKIVQQYGDTIEWSPDNLKFLYYTEKNGERTYGIYNKESDQLYQTLVVPAGKFAAVHWYADSQHVAALQKDSLEAKTGTVSLLGMDGSNKVQAFSGTLIDDTLYSYLDGSKLVILTSFNQQSDEFYLYSINLR